MIIHFNKNKYTRSAVQCRKRLEFRPELSYRQDWWPKRYPRIATFVLYVGVLSFIPSSYSHHPIVLPLLLSSLLYSSTVGTVGTHSKYNMYCMYKMYTVQICAVCAICAVCTLCTVCTICTIWTICTIVRCSWCLVVSTQYLVPSTLCLVPNTDYQVPSSPAPST